MWILLAMVIGIAIGLYFYYYSPLSWFSNTACATDKDSQLQSAGGVITSPQTSQADISKTTGLDRSTVQSPLPSQAPVPKVEEKYITMEYLSSLPEPVRQEIFKLYADCFEGTADGRFDNFSEDTILFLYVIGERIVGMVGCLYQADLLKYLEKNGITDTDAYGIYKIWNGVFIYNVCVAKEYRRRGIAAKLMEALVDWTQETNSTVSLAASSTQNAGTNTGGYIDYLHLIVKSDNPGAIKLYEKYGFTIDKQAMEEREDGEKIMVYVMNRAFPRACSTDTTGY